MNVVPLSAETGRETGSGPSKRLRVTDQLPGTVYGLGMPAVTVSVQRRDLRVALDTDAGTNALLELTYGGETHFALVKELQRQMSSLLYERAGLSTDKKGLIQDTNKKAEPFTPKEIMRDPYVFEFVGLEPKEKTTEKNLEEALISHLQEFLLELGKGFCFEARQKRLTIDGEYYYVDLVFYHRILKCHILIDLKTRKFKHTDAGQMNFYLNYYRDKEVADGDHPPAGIVLCTDKKSSTVKYATGSLDNHLFVSRYQVQLPTPKELEEFIKQDIEMLEGG